MPLSPTHNSFRACIAEFEPAIPLLLGGTGKKSSEDHSKFLYTVYAGVNTSLLQSLIAFMAGNIQELENEKTLNKFLLIQYKVALNTQTENDVESYKEYTKSQIQRYARLLANTDKQLNRLRKIQTELKRQRAGKI